MEYRKQNSQCLHRLSTIHLKKKIILMFLGSIILAIATSCIADTIRQPNQPSKISNLDRTEAFTSNLPIVIVDTSGNWIRDEPKIPAQVKAPKPKGLGLCFVDNDGF